MNNEVIISVVLGSYQRLPFLKKTIESVRHEVGEMSHEIIVVDGGSTDGSIEWLSNQKDIILIIQNNHGQWSGKPVIRKSWGYFMNLGFRAATGKFICMISDDCLLVRGSILNALREFDVNLESGSQVGALAFYWRNWPEENQYKVGCTWGSKIYVNHGIYLKTALQAVGYADAESYNFYHADGDLCLRLNEASYETLPASNSYVEHFAHAGEAIRALNNATQQKDWNVYLTKWGSLGNPKNDWLTKEFIYPNNTYKIFTKIPKVALYYLAHPIILKLQSHSFLHGLLVRLGKKVF